MPMGAHQHHVHKGESRFRKLPRAADQPRRAVDGMRASVFEALAGFDRPASAYDIAEAVSNKQGRRVAANSVYRILDLFVGANLARRWKAPTPMSPMLIPTACTTDLPDLAYLRLQAVHIDDDALSGGVRKAAASAGFSASRPVIEVRGTCGDCGED